MTISRERMMIALTGPGQAEFASPGARHDGRNPWMLVTSIPHPASVAPNDLLCLIAEPIDAGSHLPVATGAGILAGIRDIYETSDRDDPLAALTTALEAANLALYQQNLSTAPGRRLLMGLTCLVARGRELLICQVPPTQLLLSQGGVPVVLPELATWGADYQPHTRETYQGLGVAETLSPALFRATLEQGDLITFCSSNLARLLAAGEPTLLEPLLGIDPVEAVESLASLAEHHELDPAYAASIAPQVTVAEVVTPRASSEDAIEQDGEASSPAESDGWFERSLREMRNRSRVIPWPRLGARHDTSPHAVWAEADERPLHSTGQQMAVGAAGDEDFAAPLAAFDLRINHAASYRHDSAAADDGWEDEMPAEPLAPRHHRRVASAIDEDIPDLNRSPQHHRRSGLLQGASSVVALLLLGVGTLIERVVPRGGRRRSARYLEGGRERVWPIGSLERYHGKRRPLDRALPLVIVAVLAVVTLGVVLAVRSQRAHAEQARFDSALAAVVQTRQAALASSDRQAAHNQLVTLPTTLAAIPASDKPGRPEQIAAEAAAIAAARDTVDGVQRVAPAAINLLAPWPANAAPIGTRAQVVFGAGKQYVLSNGTVYWLNGGKTLTKLIAKGDTIASVSVGPILGIAWREDSLLVYTETQGFVRDSTGTWNAGPLAASGQKITASDSFGGNLYFLEAERGQIVKYASSSYNQSPQPWSASKLNADLTQAVDITIDADIYALLADGRILDLYQGDLKATLHAATVPSLAGATAITSTLGGKWLYIVDAREGRIVRIGRDGSQPVTYKPAEGAKTFTGARDIAVDEAANTAYLITDEGIVSVRLP